MKPRERRETVAFVVPAPGYYGDRARVLSAHYSVAAAIRAAARNRPSRVARLGANRKGEMWFRVYDEVYPIATSTPEE